MYGKIKNILKKTALLLTLGLTCIIAVSIDKPQEVQAASHIYKNKTFYVYAEHAVTIQSWFSDDKINGSKEFNWNDRGLGSINVYSEGDGYTYDGKNCYRYRVEMVNVDVKNKTPYIKILAAKNKKDGYYPVSARITKWNNDNGCNVKANEYKQLEETLDASNQLFAYIGYSFTGTEMEVKFDQYKFNVAYDLNGGQGDNSTQESKFNRDKVGVTLHGAPSRTGYQFTKWKCNRTEDDGEYSAGSNYYPKDWTKGHLLNSIIMTAQWEANKYYVTYKPNKPGNASHDVTGTMPARTEFKYDTGKELDNNQYNLTGWTFTGWNTKADGSGDSYTNSQTVTNLTSTNGATITLYAQWEANKYRINLEKMAGENGTDFFYEKYDTGFYSDENCKNKIKDKKIKVPSRVNYKFNGYFTEKNNAGTVVIDTDGNIKCSANFFPDKININDGKPHYEDTTSTVYASWIPATYKIILDDNGGWGGSGAIYEWFNTGYYADKNHNQGISSVKIPERTGYTFCGYWTRKNNSLNTDEPMLESTYKWLVDGTIKIGDNGSLDNLSSTDFSKNTTLYALWVPKEFTITLSSEDADISHGTPQYTEVYGYYNYANVPKVSTNGATKEDTPSSKFTGSWETFTAPYTGEYTFTDGSGNSKKVTLKQGETIKIYNSTN